MANHSPPAFPQGVGLLRLLGRLFRQAAREGLDRGAREEPEGPSPQLSHYPAGQHGALHLPAGRGQLPVHVHPRQVQLGRELVQQLQDLQVVGLRDCHAAGSASHEQGPGLEGYGKSRITDQPSKSTNWVILGTRLSSSLAPGRIR